MVKILNKNNRLLYGKTHLLFKFSVMSEGRNQAIAPNPHTNLLNVYIQLANKMGFKKNETTADSYCEITGRVPMVKHWAK
jgi:hypothetical protein